MPYARFSRYVLRTTDVPVAEAFYETVLGHHGDQIFPLHEQAIARGARPHWLGHIDVGDPAAAAAPLLAAGAQQLGERPDGVVVLRDPGGAIVALGGVTAASEARVVQHVLRARDAESVAARYAELFGWSLGERIELDHGESYRSLAWKAGEPSVGAVGEVTEGVHPHWLFFFGVDSLAGATASARAHGGAVVAESVLPDGTRYAVCDDPQGAAFGLMEAPHTLSRS